MTMICDKRLSFSVTLSKGWTGAFASFYVASFYFEWWFLEEKKEKPGISDKAEGYSPVCVTRARLCPQRNISPYFSFMIIFPFEEVGFLFKPVSLIYSYNRRIVVTVVRIGPGSVVESSHKPADLDRCRMSLCEKVEGQSALTVRGRFCLGKDRSRPCIRVVLCILW